MLNRPIRNDANVNTLEKDAVDKLYWVNTGENVRVSPSKRLPMSFKRINTHPTYCGNPKRFKRWYAGSMCGFLPMPSRLRDGSRAGLIITPVRSTSVSNFMDGVTLVQVIRTFPGKNPQHRIIVFSSFVKINSAFRPKRNESFAYERTQSV